jgi:hypothetical protein
MLKQISIAASALALAAFVSQTVSAATVTCEMPISRGTAGGPYDSGQRRFEYCTADGFTGEANVLRYEIAPSGADDSQLWLTVSKTAGAGSAHLYILDGSLGTPVVSTGGSCVYHDALGGGSTGTTTNPCITSVNVENLHMQLQVDH